MIAPIDVTHIRIETTRLILRPIQQADVFDLHTALSDESVAALAGFPLCKTFDDSRWRVNRCQEKKHTLVPVLKDTGTVLGTISLHNPDQEHCPIDQTLSGWELGFLLTKDHWGQGLMPEALNAVCDYCFQMLGQDFLICSHFVENHQCARTMDKCNFSYLCDATANYPDGRKIPVRTYIRYASCEKGNCPIGILNSSGAASPLF